MDVLDNEEFCLESLYDNALDDGPMLLDDINYDDINGIGEVLTLARRSPIHLESDQSSCYYIVKSGFGEVMTLVNVYPTILELDINYVLVDHEKRALCDGYIVDFVHDVTKTPVSMLKILKVLLFYLPMLYNLCFIDLFAYKMPMHRKHVRLKCGLSLLL